MGCVNAEMIIMVGQLITLWVLPGGCEDQLRCVLSTLLCDGNNVVLWKEDMV